MVTSGNIPSAGIVEFVYTTNKLRQISLSEMGDTDAEVRGIPIRVLIVCSWAL